MADTKREQGGSINETGRAGSDSGDSNAIGGDIDLHRLSEIDGAPGRAISFGGRETGRRLGRAAGCGCDLHDALASVDGMCSRFVVCRPKQKRVSFR